MRIAVVGCGIGGLAVASFLADTGYEVDILDQFTLPAAVGSGLVIQPVGFDVLNKLGIAEELLEQGACGYQMLGLEVDSGRTVLDVTYGEIGGDSFGLGIHRATLFDALLTAAKQRNVKIHHASKVLGSEIKDGFRYLNVEHNNNNNENKNQENISQKGPYDLVIDASGVNSTLSPLKSKELPFGAIWGTVDWPEETQLQYNQLEQRYRKAHNMIGILPIGYMPNDKQAKATLFWSMPRNNYDHWLKTDIQQWHEEAEALWPALAPFVRQITHHSQMTMARYSHGQLLKPYAEQLVFIGDSAHRASPQLGQGANMALLDAYALATSLKKFALPQNSSHLCSSPQTSSAQPASLNKALKAYATARRNHVMIYQTMSWAFTPMYQSNSKLLPFLRDRLFAPMSKVPPVPKILTSLVKGTMVDACKGLK